MYEYYEKAQRKSAIIRKVLFYLITLTPLGPIGTLSINFSGYKTNYLEGHSIDERG